MFLPYDSQQGLVHHIQVIRFCGVYIGNDKACVVVRMGQVKIAMDDSGVRMLCDVRHIPELRKNLISFGTLYVNGFRIKIGIPSECVRGH